MTEAENRQGEAVRTAACSCGNFRLALAGAPERVYACACLECQKATGSAFSYRARYRKQAIVADEGERRRFRRITDEGRWMDQVFCPNCGTLVYMEAEVLENGIVVSVGCFGEPDFAPPAAIFWSRRRHGWYEPDAEIRLVE
ncbi:GFA family protein [Neorhizobium sp. T25_27]|uniref:GFA family protein n=1 Tax=Neorhizobium sp. T25_27 TaxID=2093831 RepID=UPI000CF95AC7|nr:GFA family protein [Neorhizobium sp. T25_27]